MLQLRVSRLTMQMKRTQRLNDQACWVRHLIGHLRAGTTKIEALLKGDTLS
jgi:hypothetical protein